MDFEIIAAFISFAGLVMLWASAPTVPAMSEAPAKVAARVEATV
jgi:hypothetical protein